MGLIKTNDFKIKTAKWGKVLWTYVSEPVVRVEEIGQQAM